MGRSKSSTPRHASAANAAAEEPTARKRGRPTEIDCAPLDADTLSGCVHLQTRALHVRAPAGALSRLALLQPPPPTAVRAGARPPAIRVALVGAAGAQGEADACATLGAPTEVVEAMCFLLNKRLLVLRLAAAATGSEPAIELLLLRSALEALDEPDGLPPARGRAQVAVHALLRWLWPELAGTEAPGVTGLSGASGMGAGPAVERGESAEAAAALIADLEQFTAQRHRAAITLAQAQTQVEQPAQVVMASGVPGRSAATAAASYALVPLNNKNKIIIIIIIASSPRTRG
ncbi:hypothetical protein T492DRAFT_218003 [Pavlovales sp. CCMP2436]|nr:hypothetical protein T492DRAFT_218003 [Pavlovales sp. CCMP2436]